MLQGDEMLKELLDLVNNANNAVDGLPEAEDRNFFDIKTRFIEQPLVDRDDDPMEPAPSGSMEKMKPARALSKEEDESLIYLGNNEANLEVRHIPKLQQSLRLTLIDVLGERVFA
jgi:hypothetical protein